MDPECVIFTSDKVRFLNTTTLYKDPPGSGTESDGISVAPGYLLKCSAAFAPIRVLKWEPPHPTLPSPWLRQQLLQARDACDLPAHWGNPYHPRMVLLKSLSLSIQKLLRKPEVQWLITVAIMKVTPKVEATILWNFLESKL